MVLRIPRLASDGRTKAKAFALLQGRLFQLPGVEGVAVQGFAKSSHGPNSESGVSVLVITSGSATTEFEEKIEEIVSAVNLSYGAKLEAVVVDWKTFDSSFTRAHHAATQSLPVQQ
jgi:pyruvate-formate lyase-activating enzyme